MMFIITVNLKLYYSFIVLLNFRDGFLNKSEFGNLLQELFSKGGKPYQISEKLCQDILKLLDQNQVRSKYFACCILKIPASKMYIKLSFL